MKFKIVCDNQCQPYGSTDIIVKSINKAAQEIGLYDESGKTVVYDTLCQNHGYSPDAFWCAFELNFPRIIMSNAMGRPILGLSKENALFAVTGGYSRNLVNYVSLGIDSNIWRLTSKKYNKDKFVFISRVESNVRCGFEILVPAFGELFGGKQDVQLILKDRNATDVFKTWVKEKANEFNANIVLDDRHIEDFEEQVKIYEGVDACINLNKSHTWGMTCLEGISCGIPSIAIRYSGFSDYCTELNTASVDFRLENLTQDKLNELQSIGMKNHFLPINTNNYINQPFWAVADKNSLQEKMLLLYQDRNLREQLSYIGRLTSEWFSWERCASNMSFVLDNLEKQRDSKTLIGYKSRYE